VIKNQVWEIGGRIHSAFSEKFDKSDEVRKLFPEFARPDLQHGLALRQNPVLDLKKSVEAQRDYLYGLGEGVVQSGG
jgi:hypothetical protein